MNFQEIKILMHEFDHTGLSELKIRDGDFELKFKKNSSCVSLPPVAVQSVQSISKEDEIITTGFIVKAPLVGVYYKSSSPGEKPYVICGDSVKKGQVICLIEAMKTINEIIAPVNGIIKNIFTEDGDMVAFGDPIIEIQEH